jgi:hypothetical protein
MLKEEENAMTQTAAAPAPMPATWEEYVAWDKQRWEESHRNWEESHRKWEESQQNWERAQQDWERRFKETDRMLSQKFKETDRLLKDLSRKYGDLTDRLGEVVEHLVAPDMQGKFNALGFTIHSVATDVERYDEVTQRLLYEIDILLENGDKAIAVEVKTKVKVEHIDEHCERMEKIRAYADAHGDKRLFYGAIAGAVFNESVRAYALKKGFYVIEQTGDTLRIVEPECTAKAW